MKVKVIRKDVISDCRQRGIICKDDNLNPPEIFKSICNTVINHTDLTKHEKQYLINELIKIRDAQNIIGDIGERRTCAYCNNQVIAITYCERCIRNYLQRNSNKWTTGNIKLDELIQECQINSVSPSDIFEWIPFESFKNVEFKEEGSFSSLYVAIWENGPFTEWDAENQELKRCGEGSYILRNLKNSGIADELCLTLEKFSQSLIKCYGLTRNPETQDIMIVLEHMDNNLNDFLAKTELTWKIKFRIVRNISNGIRKIHNQKAIHKNLHSRNVLVDESKPHCVVSDFENLLKEIYENDGIIKKLKLIPFKISRKKKLLNWFKFKCQRNKKLSTTKESNSTPLIAEQIKSSPLIVEKDKSPLLITDQDESLLLVDIQNKSRIYQFNNLPLPKNAAQGNLSL
ncbi:9994_t:CDS:2 [Scutellospora calospora]|uniref:9994_t:CDS:1 n=1 Tax=Scutellospora calospora TaxID=85575 RepID=A0ACA9JU51_9GLOM|nr:9994_t:CDS:2 [Scutellospora calospora]